MKLSVIFSNAYFLIVGICSISDNFEIFEISIFTIYWLFHDLTIVGFHCWWQPCAGGHWGKRRRMRRAEGRKTIAKHVTHILPTFRESPAKRLLLLLYSSRLRDRNDREKKSNPPD